MRRNLNGMRVNLGSASKLALLGIALLVLLVLGLAVLTCDRLPLPGVARARVFVATECAAGLLWLGAVALVLRGGLASRAVWFVLAAAVAMRAIVFVAPPLLSSDMYRYVWDGRVQRAGINPYRYLPAAPELAFLRDSTVYPLVNRGDYAPTIYPPAAELLFALAAYVAPGVYGMKAMMTVFDALAIVALWWLLRLVGRDPAEVLIYAWLPLPVWEFAGNAHVDAVAAGCVALALLCAAYRRNALTGLVMAVVTLTKFLPAVILPALWRPRDWRLPVVFVLAIAAFYAPYLGVGRQVLGFLGGYVSEERLTSGGGIFLLQWLDLIVKLPSWSVPLYGVLVLAVLAAIAASFVFTITLSENPSERVVQQARQAAILGAVLLVALSPHYPWYVGWLAPLACLASLFSLYWLLAAAPLLALGPIEHWPIPVAVYVPTAALAVVDFARIRRNVR